MLLLSECKPCWERTFNPIIVYMLSETINSAMHILSLTRRSQWSRIGNYIYTYYVSIHKFTQFTYIVLVVVVFRLFLAISIGICLAAKQRCIPYDFPVILRCYMTYSGVSYGNLLIENINLFRRKTVSFKIERKIVVTCSEKMAPRFFLFRDVIQCRKPLVPRIIMICRIKNICP